MAITHYESNKRWRYKNPKKRNRGNVAYFRRHMYGKLHNVEPYTIEEDTVILTKMLNGKKMLDREIAKYLCRSLKGIQIHRCKLKRKK